MKPRVTRTYGPIHFEDLDPHRFEDLIRELIYDYKDWQSIEATGRGGSDDGFDIRAYEKIGISSQSENENNELIEEIHPMEGNLWMIQGKRENSIGPAKLAGYLAEVDAKNPPYGYIMAASANFSKKAYDVFREELQKKGVMEFYLWGKAELEDMLHLPKNDRIMFTFFGFSLFSKRRSRTTEVRSVVNIKNKLYRVLGDAYNLYRHILVRDLKDVHYPFESKYSDFDKKPRWKEYIAFKYHPLGLWCHNHKYLAYVDTEKKEWDFTNEIDFIFPQVEDEEVRIARIDKQSLVNDSYDFFPKNKQCHFIVDGLIKYSDIVLVDDKGDELYALLHFYVDFIVNKGPFAGVCNFLEIGNKHIEITDQYTRINKFPKQFKKKKYGKIHTKKSIDLDEESLRWINNAKTEALYDCDGRYGFLNSSDIISINEIDSSASFKRHIQITHSHRIVLGDYLNTAHCDSFMLKRSIDIQLGRDVGEKEEINIHEYRKVYEWQFQKKKI